MYGIAGDQLFGSGGPFLTFGQSDLLNTDPRRAPMGYYTGFLPTGAGQTSAGPSLLSTIATGLETFLPVIFGGSKGGGGLPSAGTVPVGVTTGQTPTSHPTLTKIGAIATGTAVAGGVMATLDPGMVGLGGHRRGRYAPPGTKGYHPIKKGPHAGQWTRNRHRNVANIHALRRALSRAHGFERVARKVCHFVKPGGGRGRAIFKRRRRRC